MYPRYLNTAMSFATTKICDQQRCLSADWIRKIWYSHIMEVLKTIYYLLIYYCCMCTHVCIVCMCTQVCIHTGVGVHVCVCVYMHMYVCVYVYVYVYI